MNRQPWLVWPEFFFYGGTDDEENFDIFGENTDYVIDPEETMADNFSYTIIDGPGGREYPTPEIIEKIDAYLKNGLAD